MQQPGGDTFTTADLHPAAAAALDLTPDRYPLASLRYDLSKLRLLTQGYRFFVLFLKLFERV